MFQHSSLLVADGSASVADEAACLNKPHSIIIVDVALPCDVVLLDAV